MTTAPSRLTSSTGSSCFLTSGIAVQLPRLFLIPWRFKPRFCSPYTLISRATCSIFRGAHNIFPFYLCLCRDIKIFRREKGRFVEFRYCIAGSWQYYG